MVSKPYCGVDGALKKYFCMAPRGGPRELLLWQNVAPTADSILDAKKVQKETFPEPVLESAAGATHTKRSSRWVDPWGEYKSTF